MVRYEINDEDDEMELYFDGFPGYKLINEMKRQGLWWNPDKKCWRAKQWNDKGVKFIKDYCKEFNQDDEEIITFDKMIKGRCCYVDKITNFYKETENDFINKIKSSFLEEHVVDLSDSQINAWADSFRVMQNIDLNPNLHIIFEYVLPYESGRRPDIILLSNEYVIILEFKMKNEIKAEDIDQAKAYARDITEYHFESRDKKVIPLLVLTRMNGLNEVIDDITCVSADLLQKVLDNIFVGDVSSTDVNEWISSKYEPLPTIVEAAKNIMNHEDLPNIRRVNSTVIPQTLDNLKKLTSYAKDNKKHIISFVTGVPGAGKTYLGLQYVYDIEGYNSVYLSGNGPLVKVLNDALKSNVFVKDLHKVENEYLRFGAKDFNNNVIVFDEGQRAWDVKQMQAKKRGNFSEPDVMISLCEDRLDWCVLLILVGEGQEIYNGENSGIELWNLALDNGKIDWEVVCSPKLFDVFSDQKLIEDIDNSTFDLTVSLRSHLSGAVSQFVNYLIDADIDSAAELAPSIYAEGYNMYCTRDIEVAKSYCKNRYCEEPDKKYGLLASSKAKGLAKFGIDNSFNGTRNTPFGKWFNAPADDPKSCCQFKQVVTEFGIQGLELDMPIIAWGLDMRWEGNDWAKFKSNEQKTSDANTYRVNSYRVLLTRGRDGFIVFVPPFERLKGVYDLLLSVGIKELK